MRVLAGHQSRPAGTTHMQPGDRPCLAGAPFDEIAHSVDEPQAVSACGVGWEAPPAIRHPAECHL
jgi:hypothetical protein